MQRLDGKYSKKTRTNRERVPGAWNWLLDWSVDAPWTVDDIGQKFDVRDMVSPVYSVAVCTCKAKQITRNSNDDDDNNNNNNNIQLSSIKHKSSISVYPTLYFV